MIEKIILILIGYGVGLIAMRCYDIALLHKIGLSWKFVKGKISEEKLREMLQSTEV